jgi:hypothetical protein
MNCYACLVETGCNDEPAFAVCQHCGAGICHTHLVEVTVSPPVGSINATPTNRHRLLCQRCYRSIFPSSHISRSSDGGKKKQAPSRKPVVRNWWTALWPRRQVELPDPEEAIAIAEQFLKQQKRQS